ncbi:MAG TPA: hypothetical protein VL400_22815 [Polyangiaceae bacterium]|jgi:hypothetical protein|nr:hypothetical protein [Polyangiaceae bacterium]
MTEGTTSTRDGSRGAAAPPLSLEHFAELAAELDAGVDEAEALERASVREEAWAEAKAFWLRRMADEAERKRFEITTRYQAVFKARRAVFEAKLRRERVRATRAKVEPPTSPALDAASRELATPLVSSLAPLDLPVAPPSATPLVHRAPPIAPMPVAPPMASMPMASPMASMPIAPPMASPIAPPISVAPTTQPMPPVASPIAAAHASPGPVPPAFAPKPQKFATMMADARDFQPATPFKAGAAAPPKPSSDVPRPKRDLGATMMPDADELKAALPFAGAGAVALPPAAAPQKRSLKAGATMMADASDFVAPALPFGDTLAKKAGPSEPPRAPAKVASSTPPAPPAPLVAPHAKASSSTVALDAEALHAAIAALPFRDKAGGDKPGAGTPAHVGSPPPSPAPGPSNGPKRFTINVFASLTAEIAEGIADVDVIRKRYGVNEAEHHEESLRWTEEFAKNDELRARYFGIVQRYRAYLKGRK